MSTRASQSRRNAGRAATPHLRVVRRKSRNLMVRSESRRLAPTVIAAGIAVMALVVGVLLEQVVLAQSAFKLASVRERLVAEEERNQDLMLEATRLESSARIESYAREVLGMVEPDRSVTNYMVADVRLRDPLRVARGDRPSRPAAGQAAGGLISDRVAP